MAASHHPPAPSVEYHLLMPMLIVFGAAVISVLLEAFMPRRARYASQLVVAAVGIVGGFIAIVGLAGTRRTAMSGAVAVDNAALLMQATLLVSAALGVTLMAQRSVRTARAEALVAHTVSVESVSVSASSGGTELDYVTAQAATEPGSDAERLADSAGMQQTEIFPLTLFATGGMMVFVCANDLLTMFVALEVLSLPLYVMCALARRQRLASQEAAMKYFLLGAFSSAFFLFGAAFVFGATNTVRLPDIAEQIRIGHGDRTFLLLGLALLSVGLLFKVGAVPFHFWVPDVYQGAPTPVTAFMGAATKVAAFLALARLLLVAFPGLKDDWRPILWIITIATMVIGSIAAITQGDVKRMLAYSAVAHTGFILTGIIAADHDGLSAMMFYLLIYAVSTVGAFAAIGLVRGPDGQELTDLRQWVGLGRRSPLLGLAMSLFLLSFAGIPLTGGFIGKFAVFRACAGAGAAPLIIVGVVCSAIAAYFYVRVIVSMYFTDADPRMTSPVPMRLRPTAAVVALCAAFTLFAGVAPQVLLDMANHAAVFAP
ncbi:NADH-quinone oxidoreductase subunit NuoN [Jongsikchunia kroppenstedtii]|uniref:NADH-quinone oxidoreductase subunit NuoN n=1 Tax=Jongsikchunia kroppenstedtii TaxID=1121721 RepID=UPI000477EC8B